MQQNGEKSKGRFSAVKMSVISGSQVISHNMCGLYITVILYADTCKVAPIFHPLSRMYKGELNSGILLSIGNCRFDFNSFQLRVIVRQLNKT
jgi:hypothetical protein